MAALALDISDVAPAFPAYRVALVLATELEITPDRPVSLDAAISETEAAILDAYRDTPLADIPELQAWRTAYKSFGVKKTSYRSSVERLLKAIQQGRGLPRVNSLVDGYNAVSAHYRMPVGADDLDKVSGPLTFRYARPGDSFIALGDASGRDDPPKQGEVVYTDAQHVLCRRWNWYQDARTAVTTATTGAVLTVQSLAPAPAVEEAAAELCDRLGRFCGASTVWAVADRAAPVASVESPSSRQR